MSLATRSRKWRLTALGGLLLLVAAVASPSFAKPVEAHTGSPGTECGSTNMVTAYYAGQYTNGDGSHYHRWDPIGPDGIFDWFCGYNP